jgi:hypothetical protein
LPGMPHDRDLPYAKQDGDEDHRTEPDEQFQIVSSHFRSMREYGVAGQV